MLHLLEKNLISLPPIRAPDSTKPLPPNYRPNSYCHFYRQNGHDIEHCKHLKHLVQDLIDSNHISIGGVNDQWNKFVAPPNQNFQIFTNPMPNHNYPLSKLVK